MLVLKALLQIGMEKIVPNKHSRRHSTGNLAFENTDVLSRYLKDPVSSRHDNCKQLGYESDNPNRSNRNPPTSKKIFTPIPKYSTKDVKITNASLPKHQLKPLPMEPKKHGFLKSKSKTQSNDPFYIPPSRTHRRRYSEIILPTDGLGDVLDQPAVPSLTTARSSKKIDNKIEPRKNPNPNPNPKPDSGKTSGNGNISRKVQTLKTHNNLPKPGVDHGSRKSKPAKPVGEVVQEEIDNTDETDKTPSPTSNESEEQTPLTSNEVETIRSHDQNNGYTEAKSSDETLKSDDRINGCNEAQIPSTSKKDETLRSHDQNNGVAASGGKKPETPRRTGKLVKENGDYSPLKMKFKQGKMVDAQSGCSNSRKLMLGKQVLDEKTENQDDNKVSLRRLSSNGVLHSEESKKSVNVVLEPQHVAEKNKRHSGLNNVIEETASKLIQTRKSRVKALVGAFEMISETQL